jgi:hypothetical protein
MAAGIVNLNDNEESLATRGNCQFISGCSLDTDYFLPGCKLQLHLGFFAPLSGDV